MVEELVIRRPLRTDAPGLLAMIEALTRYHRDAPRVTLASVERDLLGPDPWFHAIVAELGGALTGYAAMLPLARLGYGERGMDLHHLFVAETVRGLGIGTALVRACEAKARDLGCGYMIIGTHPGNRAAQEYYRRLGYGQMGNTSIRFTRRFE